MLLWKDATQDLIDPGLSKVSTTIYNIRHTKLIEKENTSVD
jgi:hypothetical protein